MEKKQKVMAKRLIVSAVLMIAGVILEKQSSWAWLPYVLAYLAAGYDIPLKALTRPPAQAHQAEIRPKNARGKIEKKEA